MKAMRNFPIAIVLLLLFVGLSTTFNQKSEAFYQSDKKVIKIQILNKANYYKNEKKVVEITKKGDIDALIEQIGLMQKAPDANVKASFGDYEINIFYDNGKTYSYYVVYTVYFGVIIFDLQTNGMYKNDKIEYLVVNYLRN